MRRLAAVLLLALVPACSVRGLDFVQDRRVDIVTPGDRAKVELPTTIRWTTKDFDGTYAVFVDRAPQPPGETLEWFARRDQTCKSSSGCPDRSWFTDRWIFRTAKTSFELRSVPELRGEEKHQFHDVTIVLLDHEGRRVGESAFGLQLEVPRDRRP